MFAHKTPDLVPVRPLRLANVAIASCGIWGALAGAPADASAQPGVELAPHARLLVEAEGLSGRCISPGELEQSVQAELGRVAFVSPGTAANLEVLVRIEELEPGRFRAVVTSAAPDSAASGATRELEANGDCRGLDEPLALVVALLVDSDSAATEPAPPPAAPPEPPPKPDPIPVQDTTPVSSAPSWEAKPAGPWNFAVGASGVLALALLPDTGFGLALEGVAAPPGWPGLRLRVIGIFPGEASVSDDASIELTWAFAGLAVCPKLVSAGKFVLGTCLGGDATFLHAESQGLSDGRDTLRVGAQVSASLVLSLALGEHFRAAFEAGTAFPLSTESYTVEQGGDLKELYRTPFGPVMLSLGGVYDFR